MENYLRSKRNVEFMNLLDTLKDEQDFRLAISKLEQFRDNDVVIYNDKNWPHRVVIKPENSPMNLRDFIETVDWEKCLAVIMVI